MAADLVMDQTIDHTFVHDLESAFYMVLWLSMRLLPNSWSPSARGHVMAELFDPPSEGPDGAHSKRNWMATSYARLCGTDSHRLNSAGPFEIANNEVLPDLILTLCSFFEARHKDISAMRRKRIPYSPPAQRPTETNATYQKEMLSHLDHEEIIKVFDSSLNVGKDDGQWPEEEPATKQCIERVGEKWRYRSSRSNKRSQSRSGIGSSQKRLRTGPDDL